MGVVKMPPGAWIGALVAEATILGLAFGFCAQLPPGRDSGGR